MKNIIKSIPFFFLLLFFACNSKESNFFSANKFDFGTIKNSYYENNYFNLKVKQPDNCQFRTFYYKGNLKNTSSDLAQLNSFSEKVFSNQAFENVKDIEKKEREQRKNAPRFVSKKRIKYQRILEISNRNTYKSLFLNTVNLKKTVNYKNLDEIAQKFQSDILKNPFSVIQENKKINIDGKEFLYIDISGNMTNQVHIDTIIKDFILEISFTYKTETELSEFLDILSQIKFEKK